MYKNQFIRWFVLHRKLYSILRHYEREKRAEKPFLVECQKNRGFLDSLLKCEIIFLRIL
jgi:hypothetical protein